MPLPSQRFSRRGFLIGTSALTVAGSLDRNPFGRLALAQQASSCPSDRAWRALAQRLVGPVLRPGDAGFDALAAPNNQRYGMTLPCGIARCTDSEDVAEAILWARQDDVPFVVRSGGHSYAGFSTTTGLMIELTLMNATQYDASNGQVTIGGGALNQNLYNALRPIDRAITHGRCPSVGAAGFLLGGGIGFNMRENGLACDQLVRSEIVTADGAILHLSATENSKLFWACRGGGGGNFGINTSFTLQTFAAEPVTVFEIKWSGKLKRSEAVFPHLMRALDAAPNRVGSRISLGATTKAQLERGVDVSIDLLGQFKGSARELADILAPAYGAAFPSSQQMYEMTYWQGQDFLKESTDPAYYQERSTFVQQGRPLDDRARTVAFEWLRNWPGTRAGADLRFFQTGGRVNEPAPDATAFVHRDSSWIMDVGLNWTAFDTSESLRANHEWQDGFYRAMLRSSTGGAYQNFADPSLADWQHAYYGNNFTSLTQVKSAVDPANVFRFPQSIPPA